MERTLFLKNKQSIKIKFKRTLLCLGIFTTVSLNAQMALVQNFNTVGRQTYETTSFVKDNEKYNLTNSFKKSTNVATPACERYADIFTMEDIPFFSRGEWAEHSNLLFGKHYKQYFEFRDGVSGFLFKGAMSGKYFISNDGGNIIYFTGLRTAIRGLYIYKRFGFFTKYGRD